MDNVKQMIKISHVAFQKGKHVTCYMLHFTLQTTVFFLLLFFASCNQKPAPNAAVFGETDSLLLAQDTSTQLIMENSHEFMQTLTVSANEVYDIKSSSYVDGTEHKKFLILHRGTGNEEDTLLTQNYPDKVLRAELADLDRDEKKEIVVYYSMNTLDPNFTHIASVLICKPSHKGEIDFISNLNQGADDIKYKSSEKTHDTLYLKDNFIVRKYPLYEHRKDSIPKGTAWIYYEWKTGKFIEVKKEAVL